MTTRFPWPMLAEPLTLQIDEVRLNTVELDAQSIDREHLRVHLESVEAWSEIEITVTVTHDENNDSLVQGSITYVIAECGTTHSRIPIELSGVPRTGKLRLDRTEVDQRFLLRAEMASFVGDRRRVIGSSQNWTFVMDRAAAPVPPGMPPFETVWVDFESTDAPAPARRMPEAYAYMDLAGAPQLLLNSAVDGFQHLLHADAAKLERRRLRDLLGADVARYAVTTLFRAAVAELIVDENGAVTPPESDLYRQVCEAIAERTPGVGSVDELYDKVARSSESFAETYATWAAIDMAISSLTGFNDAMSTACAEVKHA